jgi:transformation/transcription domain-associated protein
MLVEQNGRPAMQLLLPHRDRMLAGILLHETLALADADDSKLLGPRHLRQSVLEVIKLRVACIQLLTAAVAFDGFLVRQPQTRIR